MTTIRREKDPTLKTLLVQEALAKRGLYKGALDNWWAKQAEAAYQQYLALFSEPKTGIPKEAIDLILDCEGIDQPGKWPGGGSGITLGYGCDIGADPASLSFWKGILTDNQINRLTVAKGKTGQAAASIASRFKDITVTRQDSMKVFIEQSLPREIVLTRQTYPGVDKLPPIVLGMMVSITYNRGAAMEGDRRREMREIRSVISDFAKKSTPTTLETNTALEKIAGKIVSMKRLWKNQGLDGLLRRRDAEARLVRSAIK